MSTPTPPKDPATEDIPYSAYRTKMSEFGGVPDPISPMRWKGMLRSPGMQQSILDAMQATMDKKLKAKLDKIVEDKLEKQEQENRLNAKLAEIEREFKRKSGEAPAHPLNYGASPYTPPAAHDYGDTW